jgi:hypothetical protein
VAAPDAAGSAGDAAGVLAGADDAAVAALAVPVALEVAAVFDAPAELHAASRLATTPAARTETAGLDSLRTFEFPSDECDMQVVSTDLS